MLDTTCTGAEHAALPLWKYVYRLPRARRFLQLTAAAGSGPTPPLGRSLRTGKANNNPFLPPGFPQHLGLPRAPITSTVTPPGFFTLFKTPLDCSKPHIITMLYNWATSNHAGADQQRPRKRRRRPEHNLTFYIQEPSHPPI